MQRAVVELLLNVITFYKWIVIASFIVSWLVAFDVINTRSQAVYSIRRALAALTEPITSRFAGLCRHLVGWILADGCVARTTVLSTAIYDNLG